MATMPEYGGSQVQVNAGQALSPVGLSVPKMAVPETIGFGTNGLSRYARELEAKAKEAQNDMEDIRALEAENEIAEFTQTALRGENGLLNLKGENAYKPDDDGNTPVDLVMSRYKDFGSDLIKRYRGSPRLQGMIEKNLLRHGNRMYGTGWEHAQSESFNHRSTTLDVSRKRVIDSYGVDPTEDSLAVAMDGGATVLAAMAKLKGWNADQLAEAQRAFEENLGEAGITTMLSKAVENPEFYNDAGVLLDRFAPSMSPDKVLRYRRAITDGKNGLDDAKIVSKFQDVVSIQKQRGTVQLDDAKKTMADSGSFITITQTVMGATSQRAVVRQGAIGIANMDAEQLGIAAKRLGVTTDLATVAGDVDLQERLAQEYVQYAISESKGDLHRVFAGILYGDSYLKDPDGVSKLTPDQQALVQQCVSAEEQRIEDASNNMSMDAISGMIGGNSVSALAMRSEEDYEAFALKELPNLAFDPARLAQVVASLKAKDARAISHDRAVRTQAMSEITMGLAQSNPDNPYTPPADLMALFRPAEQRIIKRAIRAKVNGLNNVTDAAFKPWLKDKLKNGTQGMSYQELENARTMLSKDDYADLQYRWFSDHKEAYRAGVRIATADNARPEYTPTLDMVEGIINSHYPETVENLKNTDVGASVYRGIAEAAATQMQIEGRKVGSENYRQHLEAFIKKKVGGGNFHLLGDRDAVSILRIDPADLSITARNIIESVVRKNRETTGMAVNAPISESDIRTAFVKVILGDRPFTLHAPLKDGKLMSLAMIEEYRAAFPDTTKTDEQLAWQVLRNEVNTVAGNYKNIQKIVTDKAVAQEEAVHGSFFGGMGGLESEWQAEQQLANRTPDAFSDS